MLTRIRNASAVRKPEVVLPYSKAKHEIANLLSKEGYVGKVTKVEAGEKSGFATLRIGLKYDEQRRPAFNNIKRVSKPGLRIYRGKSELPVVLNNTGIAVMSTSQGVMTNLDAKARGIGGEVICEVY